MKSVAFIYPGDPGQKTGGYIYNNRIMSSWEEEGYKFTSVSIPSLSKHSNEMQLEKAVNIIRNIKADYYIIDGLAGAWMGSVMSKLKTHSYWVYLEHLPQKSHWQTEREAIQNFDAVITTSDYCSEKLISDGISIPIFSVLPGLESNLSVKKEYPVLPRELLMVGSISPRKAPLSVLKALSRLENIPWRMIICGSSERHGQYTQEVVEFITDSGISEQVSIVHDLSSESVYKLMLESDLFISASREETFGMAVYESLHHHLPVLARDIPSLRSIYGDDLSYFSLESLPDTLHDVLTNPFVYSDMIQSAKGSGNKGRIWKEVGMEFWDLVQKL